MQFESDDPLKRMCDECNEKAIQALLAGSQNLYKRAAEFERIIQEAKHNLEVDLKGIESIGENIKDVVENIADEFSHNFQEEIHEVARSIKMFPGIIEAAKVVKASYRKCQHCNGEGKAHHSDCEVCGGKAFIVNTQSVIDLVSLIEEAGPEVQGVMLEMLGGSGGNIFKFIKP